MASSTNLPQPQFLCSHGQAVYLARAELGEQHLSLGTRGCHWSLCRGVPGEAGEILQHLPTKSGAVLWEAGVCTPWDTLLTSPKVGVENSTCPLSCPIPSPTLQDPVYRSPGKHKECFCLSGSRQWLWPDCFSFHDLSPTQPQHSPVVFPGKLI